MFSSLGFTMYKIMVDQVRKSKLTRYLEHKNEIVPICARQYQSGAVHSSHCDPSELCLTLETQYTRFVHYLVLASR